MGIQVYEKKQQQQLKHLLVVKKFFSSKKQTKKKTCSSKSLGFSSDDTHQKNRPEKTDSAAPQKIQKPRFYSYVPFDDSVFFNKNNKEIPTKKDNSFFQFCLFLKKGKKI